MVLLADADGAGPVAGQVAGAPQNSLTIFKEPLACAPNGVHAMTQFIGFHVTGDPARPRKATPVATGATRKADGLDRALRASHRIIADGASGYVLRLLRHNHRSGLWTLNEPFEGGIDRQPAPADHDRLDRPVAD